MADPVRRSEKPHAALSDFVVDINVAGVKPHQFQKLIDKGEMPPLPEETQDIIDRFLQYRDRLPELIASLETARSGLRHVARALQTIVGELLLHVLRTEVHQLSDLRARVEVELPKALASAKLRERYKGLRAECLPDIHAVMDVVFREVSTDNAHFYRLKDLYRKLQSCQEETYLIRLLRKVRDRFLTLCEYFRDREDEKPEKAEDATCGSYPLPESRKRFHIASLQKIRRILKGLWKKLWPLRAEVLFIQFHTRILLGFNVANCHLTSAFSPAEGCMLQEKSRVFLDMLLNIDELRGALPRADELWTEHANVVEFALGHLPAEQADLRRTYRLTEEASRYCEAEQARALKYVVNCWESLTHRNFKKVLIESLTREIGRSRGDLYDLATQFGAHSRNPWVKAGLRRITAWEKVLSKIVSRFKEGSLLPPEPRSTRQRAEPNKEYFANLTPPPLRLPSVLLPFPTDTDLDEGAASE